MQRQACLAVPLAVAGLAFLLLALWPGVSADAASSRSLDIHFIDVEGGQATLIVAPPGRALLIDTGWPGTGGRDAKRIVAAAKESGISRLDFLLITHYHLDHVGGVTELFGRIPVATFLDHGENAEHGKEADGLSSAYEKAASQAVRRIVRPGDTFPLGEAEVRVLTANGERLAAALPGAGSANPNCADVKPMADDPSENARSVGILLTYGKFRFLDLGDLTWNKELALMCPTNPIGAVDIFLVSHHGMNISNSPALVWAIHPRVAVMNNGEEKGGSPEAWQVVEKSPGLKDLWQLHYSAAGGRAHNVRRKFIANPKGTERGYELILSAQPDGSFSMTNSRTGFKKSYMAD